MPSKQPPKPRKRPKQSRSQTLFKSIQEACLLILKNEGVDSLTTQRIAEVAGVTIGSIYQYFPNKEAILTTVYEDITEHYTREAAKQFEAILALSQQSLEQTLAALIDMEALQMQRLYDLNPVFFQEYSDNFDIHEQVNKLTQSLNNPSWEDWFTDFLAAHQQRIREGNVEMISFITRTTLRGSLKAALEENPDYLSSSTFKAELLEMLTRYLLK